MENVKYDKIPLENRADRLPDRNAGRKAEGQAEGQADRQKNTVFSCIHNEKLPIFMVFLKHRFLGFTRCKTAIFWGANQKQKKTTSKRKITPVCRFLGSQKKRAKNDA